MFTPTPITDIISRIKTDIKTVTQQGSATDKNSLLYAITVAMASLSYDLQLQLKLDAIPNSFIHLAKTLEDLQKFSDLFNLPQNAATGSSGYITITGTSGKTVNKNSKLTANGFNYTVQSTVTLGESVINVSSISRVGTTATVTTASNHNFASEMTVTIAGANETDYNGSFVINVTGLNTFTYTVAGSPSSPATGTITASSIMATLGIESDDTGIDTNLDNGDILTLVDSIAGVNNTAYVQYEGVTGGTDIESFSDFQDRLHERYKNPITRYNASNIELQAKKVSGVTKVWVQTATPDIGECTVYFIRGNDDDIIPDSNEVQDVFDSVKVLLDANDSESNLHVEAPTPITINITFSSLSPDSSTMRTAIENSLNQFFEETVELETDVTLDQLKVAIGNAYDSETGAALNSFSLSLPAGTTSIGTGEYPVLGTISYP